MKWKRLNPYTEVSEPPLFRIEEDNDFTATLSAAGVMIGKVHSSAKQAKERAEEFLERFGSAFDEFRAQNQKLEDPEAEVAAVAYSDDRVLTVEIDAVHFLRTAAIEELKELAACGWRGDYAADAVYHKACEQKDEGAIGLQDYLAMNPRMMNGDPVGFEIVCDEAEMLGWLQENRPEIHEQLIQADQDGPSL